MKQSVVAAALALFAVLQGCASTPSYSNSGPGMAAPSLGEAAPPLYENILQSPPTFFWDVPGTQGGSEYFYVPGSGAEPAFWVTERSFHFLDPDNRMLRYTRNDEGFSILEIKKRKGVAYTPECPILLYANLCTEEHFLMIAYAVDCREECTYRAVVFDSFTPVRIFPNNPTLMRIQRHMTNRVNVLNDSRISVVHEEYGQLSSEKTSWMQYVENGIGFVLEMTSRSSLVQVRR